MKSKPMINFVLDSQDNQIFEKPLWEMTDEDIDALNYIDLAVFRGGKFEHPYYGELNFDRPYLEKLISNFDNKVSSNAIGFNEDHSKNSSRSFGWVDQNPGSLYIKDIEFDTPLGKQTRPFLMARSIPTRRGKEMMKDKEFRYFSAEIDGDYTSREFVKIKLDNGDEVEKVVSYGPTLIGVALTNHPFIPNLPGMFSSDYGKFDRTQEGDVKQFSEKDISGQFKIMSFELQEVATPEVELVEEVVMDNGNLLDKNTFDNCDNVPAQETDLNLSNKKGDCGMKFLDLLNKYNISDSVDDKLSLLSSDQLETSDYSDIERAMLIALESQAKSEKAKDQALKIELSEIRAQRDDFAKEVKRTRRDAYDKSVNLFCSQLSTDNHHQSVINEVKDILLSLDDASRDMSFSVVKDDTKTQVDVIAIISSILAKLPNDARLDTQIALSSDAPQNAEVETALDLDVAEEIPDNVKLFAASIGVAPETIGTDIYKAISNDGELDIKLLK